MEQQTLKLHEKQKTPIIVFYVTSTQNTVLADESRCLRTRRPAESVISDESAKTFCVRLTYNSFLHKLSKIKIIRRKTLVNNNLILTFINRRSSIH